MKKKVFYTEMAYALGIVILALGTALMEKANFGMSMVVAPAYLLHLKIVKTLPFFSFGMAEYTLQAAILLLLGLAMRRFKLSYLFSFCTAVIYGLALDGVMMLTAGFPAEAMALRVVYYLLGMLLCSIGVSLLFHTYIAPEAYELFVKEVSAKIGMDIHRFKTLYDCVSCGIGVLLSFAFFGLWHFEGVKPGTILCALINGSIIGWCTKVFEARFEFKDGLKLRSVFEK